MTMPDDSGHRVCAVCARTLTRRTDRISGFVSYLHPFDMNLTGSDDHPPVPVLPSEVANDARCDFCFMRNPRWVLPVHSFSYDEMNALGMPDEHGSMGSWAACDTCAELLKSDSWTALTRRAIAAYHAVNSGMGIPELDPESQGIIEMSIRVLYFRLRKNVAGPVGPNPNYRPEG